MVSELTVNNEKRFLDEPMTDFDLTGVILGCCFDVMKELGSGFLEVVYKRALKIMLEEKELFVQQEVPFEIFFKGQKIGHYIADLVVNNKVVIELKACKILLPEHKAQVINYLKVSRMSTGLLVNFGQSKLEYYRLYS